VKSSIIYTLALLLAGTLAQAQYHEFKLNLCAPGQTNLSGYGLISYGAMYEYGINPDLGINTNAQLSFYSLAGNDNLSTLTFTADLRNYFFEWNGGDGWFGSIYSKYRSLKAGDWWPTIDASGNSSTEDYASGAIAFGLAMGRKWVLADHLVMECYAGLGRYLINFEGERPDNFDVRMEGFFEEEALELPIDVRFGLSLGYRF
jgi:hypothetical protein